MQRAGAQQHLAAGFELLDLALVLELHADGAFALQQDARGVGAGEHLQVGACQVRRQIGFGGAETLAVLVRHLVHAHAFLVRAVEVGVVRIARLLPGLDKRRAKPVGAAQIHHVQRAATAMKGVRRRARCVRRVLK